MKMFEVVECLLALNLQRLLASYLIDTVGVLVLCVKMEEGMKVTECHAGRFVSRV